MAINRPASNFRLREDIIDSITPNVEVQPEIRNPAGDWKPAAWLPIQWTTTNASAGEDAFVTSAGKAVAFDKEGRLVPAGIRTLLGGNGATGVLAGTVLTYTATDLAYRVDDLVTGEILTAAVSYTGKEVADALLGRGLVDIDDTTVTLPISTDAEVNQVIDLFISRSVGIAAYDFFVYSGRAHDGDQKFTNYSMQQGVQFITEMQMALPQRVAASTATDGFDAATLATAGTETYAAGEMPSAGEFWDAANIAQVARYAGVLTASSPVVAIGLAQGLPATNTDRTPVTCDRTGVLVQEKIAVQDISKEGDWFMDTATGVMFMHTATWATLVALGAVTTNFGYYYYTDTGVADAHRYAHFDGPCKPGDWIVSDSMSNFTVASAGQIQAGQETMGRVLAVITEPRNLLQYVKTAWNVSGMSAASQMPGTATKGFTDLITLSGQDVADRIVVLNVRV